MLMVGIALGRQGADSVFIDLDIDRGKKIGLYAERHHQKIWGDSSIFGRDLDHIRRRKKWYTAYAYGKEPPEDETGIYRALSRH